MRSRSLWIMLAAITALGTFIFFFERDLPSTDERTKLQKRVLSIEADEVDSLEIINGPARTVLARISSEGNGPAGSSTVSDWQMTEPHEARADSASINNLINNLAALESTRTISDFSAPELGLDEPRAAIKLFVAGEATEVKIGTGIPASSDIIVSVSGRPAAFQVDGSFVSELTKKPGDWRAKDLFSHSRADITRIRLTGSGNELLFAKRGDEFWLEQPLIDRADKAAIDQLISQLTGLQAMGFVDDPSIDRQALGLAPPLGVVEVVFEGEKAPFRIELGRPEEDGSSQLFARVEEQVVTLETDIFDSIERSPSKWRSAAWTTARVFEIEGATFSDERGKLVISREGPDWKRGEDRLEYAVISDLLYPITELEGFGVSGSESADSVTGIRRLAVELDDGEHRESLQLLEQPDGGFVATSSEREAIVSVYPEQAEEILQKLTALHEAEPIPGEGSIEDDQSVNGNSTVE